MLPARAGWAYQLFTAALSCCEALGLDEQKWFHASFPEKGASRSETTQG